MSLFQELKELFLGNEVLSLERCPPVFPDTFLYYRCPIILVSGLEEFRGSRIAGQSGGRCTCVKMTVVRQHSAAGPELVPCAAGTALSGSLRGESELRETYLTLKGNLTLRTPLK